MKLCVILSACGLMAQNVAQQLPPVPPVPGAVRTTNVMEICSHGTAQLRHWSRERDDRILARDGFATGPHPTVEIDHLIPLGIGGADTDDNLWAEPRGGAYGAEKKDRLEWRLRELICDYGYDPATLQREIATDWVKAYGRYFGR